MEDSRGNPVISCDCGSFKATLTSFPANSPGRLVCYCRDCQEFLQKIDRADRLDEFGGTEIVPVYPAEISFLQGGEHLQCHQLSKAGLFRWTARCCNSPIANTRAGFPWAGLFHSTYTTADTEYLDNLGPVRSRIFGRDASKSAPFRISQKISFKDMLVVLPFILKGKLLGKHKNSPFFEDDDSTPICSPVELDSDRV